MILNAFIFLNDALLLTTYLVQPQTRIYCPESTFPRNILRPDPWLTCTSEGCNTSPPVTTSGPTGLKIPAEEMGIDGNSCRFLVQDNPAQQKAKAKMRGLYSQMGKWVHYSI